MGREVEWCGKYLILILQSSSKSLCKLLVFLWWTNSILLLPYMKEKECPFVKCFLLHVYTPMETTNVVSPTNSLHFSFIT